MHLHLCLLLWVLLAIVLFWSAFKQDAILMKCVPGRVCTQIGRTHIAQFMLTMLICIGMLAFCEPIDLSGQEFALVIAAQWALHSLIVVGYTQRPDSNIYAFHFISAFTGTMVVALMICACVAKEIWAI